MVASLSFYRYLSLIISFLYLLLSSWTQLALSGDDQLRQIVAWGLSQILAIGLPGSGTVFYEVIEPYTMLYDYFQRNGFGSYRNLLEDMSFNLIMAKWLTYLGNTSHQANINAGLSSLPDENYAREIMQLFSIGLYQLNMDGSQVLDDDGIPIETYTIDDIMSFAAVWTGFEQRKERGGASAVSYYAISLQRSILAPYSRLTTCFFTTQLLSYPLFSLIDTQERLLLIQCTSILKLEITFPSLICSMVILETKLPFVMSFPKEPFSGRGLFTNCLAPTLLPCFTVATLTV